MLLIGMLSYVSNLYADDSLGIKYGGLTVYPSVRLEYWFDDNVYASGADQLSSGLTIIAPRIEVDAQHRAHRYSLSAEGELGRYSSTVSEDFDDYKLNGTADWLLTRRIAVGVFASYLWDHDFRRKTDRPDQHRPDTWESHTLGAKLQYGAQGARGRIEVKASQTGKEYTNNRQVTWDGDNDVTELNGAFYVRVRPKTSLFVAANLAEYDYRHAAATYDSSEYWFGGGVRWEATSKTSGEFRIGQTQKNMHDATRSDYTGVNWDFRLTWLPRSYSVVDVTASSLIGEQFSVGDSILDTHYGVSWRHNWTEKFATRASVKLSNLKYQGLTSRSDDVLNYGLRAEYQMRNWLLLAAGYNFTDYTSTDPTKSYDAGSYMVSVEVAM